MRIRVRLFAMQRELVGAREVTVEVPAGARVGDAWSALVALHPALEGSGSVVRFALNSEYADPAAPLGEGDELACIPPVSGGASSGGASSGRSSGGAASDGPDSDPDDDPDDGSEPTARIFELRPDPFDASILAELADRLATPEDGAVVGFVGRTRVTPGSPAPGQEADLERFAGSRVERLEYEALEPMALRVFGQIADEIADRFGVTRLAIVHRTGVVPLGDASVAIVAVSPHRGEAFDAARYAMDEVKARAPVWKAEHFADGHVWIGDPARTGPEDG
jgi:molybdopterin converting factor subunit 1